MNCSHNGLEFYLKPSKAYISKQKVNHATSKRISDNCVSCRRCVKLLCSHFTFIAVMCTTQWSKKNLKYHQRYRTRSIITRGLYTFYPLFEGQKRFFKEFFSENSAFMYGQYSRAVWRRTVVSIKKYWRRINPLAYAFIVLDDRCESFRPCPP